MLAHEFGHIIQYQIQQSATDSGTRDEDDDRVSRRLETQAECLAFQMAQYTIAPAFSRSELTASVHTSDEEHWGRKDLMWWLMKHLETRNLGATDTWTAADNLFGHP